MRGEDELHLLIIVRFYACGRRALNHAATQFSCPCSPVHLICFYYSHSRRNNLSKTVKFPKKDRFYNLLVRLVHLMRLFELSGQEFLGKTCRTLSKSISLHLSSDLIYSPKLIVFLELCSRNNLSFLRTGNMSADKLWSLFSAAAHLILIFHLLLRIS